ncbi:MAG: SsrA-binding protein [Planctomyces sp.]|jgi:SsrA-binding protein|nr:SsrA-binding protein [Planctomyces sp.]
MAAKAKPADDKPNDISVCRNRRVRHEYELFDELDCGVVLMGSEVKSIRAGKISIEEAWVRVQEGELFLVGCDIAEYPQASWLNHEAKRVRKLLAHKRELKKFCGKASERSITIVPLEIYLSRGYVKVKIALAKGRKMHDKREKLKAQDARREIRQVTRRG